MDWSALYVPNINSNWKLVLDVHDINRLYTCGWEIYPLQKVCELYINVQSFKSNIDNFIVKLKIFKPINVGVKMFLVWKKKFNSSQ